MTPDVAAYLSELTQRLEAHLGARLEGAWLAGSGALGDFDPARSDVDVQAISTARLARPELERLAADLSHPQLPCPARGLEFVLYARDEAPAFQLNLNTGPRMEQHAGYDADAEPRFWFVLDLAIARESSRPLVGLPPAALLPELPRPQVLEALGESLDWFRAHDATAAVLAACRAWAWASGEGWLSKGDAADWAAARLPDAAPVAKALAHRSDPAAPAPAQDDVAAVYEQVLPALTGGSGPPRTRPPTC